MKNPPQVIDIPGTDTELKINQELAVSQQVLKTAEKQGDQVNINYAPVVTINVDSHDTDNSKHIRVVKEEVNFDSLGVEHKEILTLLQDVEPPRLENFNRQVMTAVLGMFRTQKDAAKFLGVSARQMCYAVKQRRKLTYGDKTPVVEITE